MSDTELTILRQTQAMLDEALKLLDEHMAAFQRLSGPERAIESHVWFRKEIAKEIGKAVAPLAARIVQLESAQKILNSNREANPSQQWEKALLQSIGKFVREEIDRRVTKPIDALESKMANWKYCGTWSSGSYVAGNFVTHQGSLFVCLWDTVAEPCTDSSWQLCCKRGKDGRDGADNVRRLATAQRG